MSGQFNTEKLFPLLKDEYLTQDFSRWFKRLRILDLQVEQAFQRCFETRQEFRSLMNYRISTFAEHNISSHLNSIVAGKIHAYVPALYLSCKDIGPGFYIEHGFSSIIFAKKIGENFHLNQCVTVGAGAGGIPEIGDDVSIHCNSVVIGGIHVGSNVTVAAGATVIDSVPDDCVVASPKAIVVKRKNR